MVGMGVGVEGGHQGEAQLVHQGEVAGVLFKHGIDQDPLSADPSWRTSRAPPPVAARSRGEGAEERAATVRDVLL
jgi:hypothetical protein